MPPHRTARLGAALVAFTIVVSTIGACGSVPVPSPVAGQVPASGTAVPTAPGPRPAEPAATDPPRGETGAQTTRRATLPRRPDGFGEVRPTPPELTDRRLPTRDVLPPPADGRFAAAVTAVPDAVLARSTWSPQCPVAAADLRYVTVSFRGFDGRVHTGELLVHARAADDLVAVFGALFTARFPIEEMRVVDRSELDAPPTGDGDNTTAFVCRPAVGLTRWSAHAYGLAVDVNPFHNPYRRGDLVLPELASSYLDRGDVRPGMILDGGPVVAAFDRIGWTWGGRWASPTDPQHFSETGT